MSTLSLIISGYCMLSSLVFWIVNRNTPLGTAWLSSFAGWLCVILIYVNSILGG